MNAGVLQPLQTTKTSLPFIKCPRRTKSIPIHQPHLFPPLTRHSKSFPIHFPCYPKMLQEGFVLLQEAKIHREENCFYHILKTMHPFSKLFHGDMHMDDGNILKKFQKFWCTLFDKLISITYNNFFNFLEISASIDEDF